MGKTLTTGYIKENLDVTWRTFNLLLERVSLDDQIGHLYVVDIEFDHNLILKTINFIRLNFQL